MSNEGPRNVEAIQAELEKFRSERRRSVGFSEEEKRVVADAEQFLEL